VQQNIETKRPNTIVAPDEFIDQNLKMIEDFVIDTKFILGQGKYGYVCLA